MNKQILNSLKKDGYKITKPRLFVLSFLAESKNPKSAKEIIREAKKQGIDQATVYRNLKSFKKDGIVNEVNFQENYAYFELKDKNDHHHIVCVNCKKVKDFEGCNFKKLVKELIKKNRDFAKITNHSFELFGICKSCA